MLPTDPQTRKDTPIFTGAIMYFPLALAEVSRVSKKANDKHNPGEPMHWSRDKSSDHLDSGMRHLIDAGVDGEAESEEGLHLANAAWRILAKLQLVMEKKLAQIQVCYANTAEGSVPYYPEAKIDEEGRLWSTHTFDGSGFPCNFPGCVDTGSTLPCFVKTPRTICSCHP